MLFQFRPQRFMQRISQLMKKIEPMPLGRWNVDYCPRKMETKVDMANEDHCGPCGQYAITKLSNTTQTANPIQPQPNQTTPIQPNNPNPTKQPQPNQTTPIQPNNPNPTQSKP